MKKLVYPSFEPINVFDTCVARISDNAVKLNYNMHRMEIEDSIVDYASAAVTMDWSILPRAKYGKPGQKIIGALTKGELKNLYIKYMVGSKGDPRKIYDDILVSSGGFCPFCGELGRVFTVDHYLPKSYFPVYSILPANLVPCCHDCNSVKNSSFGQKISDQTLHPYLDNDKFSDSRWIFAQVNKTYPITMKFVCQPPVDWPLIDRNRALKHFETYNLASRYAVQAGAELTQAVDFRRSSLRDLPPDKFQKYLDDHANSNGYVKNGWKRTMYFALSKEEWFFSLDFNEPNWHQHLF